VIKKVLKEINEINSEPLDGVRLIPNEQDICDIQALIDGPGQIYDLNVFSSFNFCFNC
jgi:ubiquitin-conjugating enzyme E2 S